MEDQEREAERDIAGGFQGYRVCQDASLEIFHSLTAESRLGDGKERAGSASGSYPASRSLLSACHFLMIAFRQDAHLGEKDADAGLSP